MAGAGEDVLTLGFVIEGSTPKTLLIRGVGPTLAQFSVAGLLADPQLKIFDQQRRQVHDNNDWGGGGTFVTAFARAGAFALPPDSKDAALLVNLSPGLYTAQVSGVGNTTGVALAEIYEVP
jgi:hypothetical protein